MRKELGVALTVVAMAVGCSPRDPDKEIPKTYQVTGSYCPGEGACPQPEQITIINSNPECYGHVRRMQIQVVLSQGDSRNVEIKGADLKDLTLVPGSCTVTPITPTAPITPTPQSKQ